MADDREWDEVVAYLSRQPWPSTLPSHLQEQYPAADDRRLHEAAHYSALINTVPSPAPAPLPSSSTSSSSSSPVLLGPHPGVPYHPQYRPPQAQHHPARQAWAEYGSAVPHAARKRHRWPSNDQTLAGTDKLWSWWCCGVVVGGVGEVWSPHIFVLLLHDDS
jgi:hypothetical protein